MCTKIDMFILIIVTMSDALTELSQLINSRLRKKIQYRKQDNILIATWDEENTKRTIICPWSKLVTWWPKPVKINSYRYDYKKYFRTNLLYWFSISLHPGNIIVAGYKKRLTANNTLGPQLNLGRALAIDRPRDYKIIIYYDLNGQELHKVEKCISTKLRPLDVLIDKKTGRGQLVLLNADNLPWTWDHDEYSVAKVVWFTIPPHIFNEHKITIVITRKLIHMNCARAQNGNHLTNILSLLYNCPEMLFKKILSYL